MAKGSAAELSDDQLKEMTVRSERIRDMILANPDLVAILKLRAEEVEERYR